MKPVQLRLRTFTWHDLDAFVEIANAASAHDHTFETFTLESMRHLWQNRYSKPEQQCFVAVDEEDRPIAYSSYENPIIVQRAFTRIEIHPDFRNAQLASELINAADNQFLHQVRPVVSEGQEIYVLRRIHQNNRFLCDVCEQLGYTLERNFYHMARPLSDYQPQDTTLPQEFTVRPLNLSQDTAAVHRVIEEAFQTHWGHTPLDFNTWIYRYIERPTFNAAICFVALDEKGTIVGAAISRSYTESQPDFAWLSQLAVHPQYRKLGLGSALLHTSLRAYKTSGYQQAGLTVDAENTTKALDLYLRAGLQVNAVWHDYRKVLNHTIEFGNESRGC